MIDFIRVNYNKIEKNRKNELKKKDDTIRELQAKLAVKTSPRPTDRLSPIRAGSPTGPAGDADVKKQNDLLKSMAQTLNKDK